MLASGERILFRKGAAAALIEREGRTRRWSSLHTSLSLRRGRSAYGRGRLFCWRRGNAYYSVKGQPLP